MKKVLKSLLVSGVIIGILHFFGGKAVYFLSDKLQNQLQVGGLYINKPNGWLPEIVKENNTSRVLNLIDEKFFFTKISHHIVECAENGIELTRGKEKIIILELKKPNADRQYMSEYSFNNKDYLIMDLGGQVTVINIKRRIMLIFKSTQFDKHIVDEILLPAPLFPTQTRNPKASPC